MLQSRDCTDICKIADTTAYSLAESVVEMFDNTTELGFFVDVLLYIYHLTDSTQFSRFLAIIYEVVDDSIPDQLTQYPPSEPDSDYFLACYMSAFLFSIMQLIGGDSPCPAI